MPPALLIDTYSLFFRAHHALPPMNTQSGRPTSALYGFCTALLKELRDRRPSALAFAVDAPVPTFRHEAYAGYKAQRERAPVADTQRTPGGFFGNLFRRPIWAGVALAAVVALVAIGVGYTSLRTQVDDLTAYRNAVAAVLKDAVEPGAQLAVLKPVAGSTGPGGFAAVGDDGAVMLVMHDLAPTAGAQVYEAWLIAGQSAPVPIGAFTVSMNGTASFATAHASLGDGVTVALSLEPGPGATTPTQVVAAGTARGAS